MTDFRLIVEDLEPIAKQYASMEVVSRGIIGDELERLGVRIRRVVKRELADVKASGELERSVVYEVRMHNSTVIVYPTADHAMVVRLGSRPHWAPIGPLKRWAARKLGDERAAYPIQRAIADRGTSMHELRKRGSKGNRWPERVQDRDDFRKENELAGRRMAKRIIEASEGG